MLLYNALGGGPAREFPTALRLRPTPGGIHARCGSTCKDEVRESKAIEHGEFVLVEHWQQHIPLTGMRHEVRHRHESAQDEGHGPREVPDQEDRATDDFQDAGKPQ